MPPSASLIQSLRYMLQFKWTRLRLSFAPLIEREMQAVIAYHATLRAEIDQGKIEALEKLAELKVQVEKRAKDLDSFMEENEDEECIVYLRPLATLMMRKVYGEKRDNNVREEEKIVPWKAQNRRKDLAASTKSSSKSISPLKESKMSQARSSKALQESRMESNRLASSNCSKSKLKSNAQSIKQRPRTNKIPASSATTDAQIQQDEALPHFLVPHQPPSPLQISFNNKSLFTAQEQTMITFKLTRKDYQQILRMKVKQKQLK